MINPSSTVEELDLRKKQGDPQGRPGEKREKKNKSVKNTGRVATGSNVRKRVSSWRIIYGKIKKKDHRLVRKKKK